MQKVTFTRTVKVAKGDGSGPTYEKGKSYWLRPDSVAYWQSEDAVVIADVDAVAENEPAPAQPVRLMQPVRQHSRPR